MYLTLFALEHHEGSTSAWPTIVFFVLLGIVIVVVTFLFKRSGKIDAEGIEELHPSIYGYFSLFSWKALPGRHKALIISFYFPLLFISLINN